MATDAQQTLVKKAQEWALSGEDGFAAARAHLSELRALLDVDPESAAWALAALQEALPPAEWHAERLRIDVGLPDRAAARLALAACEVGVRSGETRAGAHDAVLAAQLGERLGDPDIRALSRFYQGIFAAVQGRRLDANRFIEEATAILGGARSRSRCRVLLYRAQQASIEQQFELTEHVALEGIELARSLSLDVFVAAFLMVRAVVALDRAEVGDCMAMLNAADALHLTDSTGIRFAEREALRSICDLLQNDFASAERRLTAMLLGVASRWPRKVWMLRSLRAIARSLQRDLEGAEEDLAAVEGYVVGPGPEDFAAAARLFVTAARDGWTEETRAGWTQFEPGSSSGRAFLRWMRTHAEAAPRELLIVDPLGVEFGGRRVANKSAPVPLRLLRRLVQARLLSEPGVGVDALAEAVWPNERMRAESRHDRVYATIYRLKKLGLGNLVESGADGYHVRDGVEIQMRDAAEPE